MTMVSVVHLKGAPVGDRGRKKDKDKNQRQRSEKREQSARVKLAKAKPSVGSPAPTGGRAIG